MNKIHFCTFGNNIFELSKYRLEKEAIKSRWFNEIHIYKEQDLVSYANSRTFKGPGGGWFWWKAEVIRLTLEKMNYGENLVWLDAGYFINSNNYGRSKYLEYIQILEDKGVLFTSNGNNTEKYYTRRDVLKVLDCDYPEFIDTDQIASGQIFLKKNDLSLEIINEWCRLSKDIRLLEGETYYNTDHPEFLGHKHDQSLLSLTVKKIFKNLSLPIPIIEFNFYDAQKKYQGGEDFNKIKSYFEINDNIDFSSLRFPFIPARINDQMILEKFFRNYKALEI